MTQDEVQENSFVFMVKGEYQMQKNAELVIQQLVKAALIRKKSKDSVGADIGDRDESVGETVDAKV